MNLLFSSNILNFSYLIVLLQTPRESLIYKVRHRLKTIRRNIIIKFKYLPQHEELYFIYVLLIHLKDQLIKYKIRGFIKKKN